MDAMQITPEIATELYYLPAADVKTPAGYMVGLDLCGPDNERLGRLMGVLVDAGRRRLRYLVVDASAGRGRCWLIGPEEIVSLDPNYRTLRVASASGGRRVEYDLGWLRSFCNPHELALAG
jgi:hypothetical protein